MAPPAASPPPSPSYLHSHATSNTPHNWEQPGCQFHDPEQLYKRWVACRRDSRNGGNTAKNARLHYGVKAAPIIPFGEGIKDFLGTFLPLPPEPGARPEWRLLVDRMVTVCRIGDKRATEAKLESLSDLLE